MHGRSLGRRQQVLAAAIEVVGTFGVEGLSYRSAELAAGVPPGTACNHFRNREALLLGVAVELDRLHQDLWDGPLIDMQPQNATQLADLLTAKVNQAVGLMSIRVRAYLTLQLEGWTHPQLREPLQHGYRKRTRHILVLLRSVNPLVPELHAEILHDYLTAIIYRQLANPVSNFQPRPAIDALLTAAITAANPPIDSCQ